jgi:WD40 repeat protein
MLSLIRYVICEFLLKDITVCEIYTEHAHPTTVAKYSPSGFYIASGDQSGKVRIWDTTQATHILKSEYQFINGPIRDIAWNDDSKRVAIVGEGQEKLAAGFILILFSIFFVSIRFGHVFLFDTGTSNGNLSGQSRPIISVDIRHARPYRLITGSEDNTVAIFEGPPFQFKTLFRDHARFVNCVRYNKDGSFFCSGGADGKVQMPK